MKTKLFGYTGGLLRRGTSMNNNYSRILILSILTLFLSCSLSYAISNPTLVFKMTADKTSLTPGEQTTIHIWAWIYSSSGMEKPNNGLDTWQLDLHLNNTGVIEIKSLNVLAPNPNLAFPAYQLSSLNNPLTGEVRSVAASQISTGAPSLTGIGVDNNIDNANNYSEICRFVIQARQNPLAYSTTYTIMNEGAGWFGYLANGELFDNSDITANGGTYFYAAGSNNVFTIVPEPTTLSLIMAAAAFSLRRRK